MKYKFGRPFSWFPEERVIVKRYRNSDQLKRLFYEPDDARWSSSENLFILINK